MPELAETVTLENGRTLTQSRAEGCCSHRSPSLVFRKPERPMVASSPIRWPDKRHLIIKSPIGVVGAIGPLEFSVIWQSRKIAPALAAGCTVVLKPLADAAQRRRRLPRAARGPASAQCPATGMGPAEGTRGKKFLENPVPEDRIYPDRQGWQKADKLLSCTEFG